MSKLFRKSHSVLLLGLPLFLIFFLLFSGLCISQPDKPSITYHEGQVLDIPQSGSLGPNIARKGNEPWSKMLSIVHNESLNILPGGEKIFNLDITEPGVVHIKIKIFGAMHRKMVVQLRQRQTNKTLWQSRGQFIQNNYGIISGQIKIDQKIISYGKMIDIILKNESDANLATDVVIGLATKQRTPD